MSRAITKEEIISNLLNFVKKHNRLPHSREIKTKNGLNTFLTIQKHFSSPQEYLKQAGMDIKITHLKNLEVNKESLIEDIKIFKNKYGKWPVYVDSRNEIDLKPPYLYAKFWGGLENSSKSCKKSISNKREGGKEKRISFKIKRIFREKQNKYKKTTFRRTYLTDSLLL